ncbi:MAG: hypothetical protein ACOCUK_00885, partial [bacterium]
MEDAKEQTKERAFDHQKLCDKLNEATGGALEPYGLHLEHLMFNGDRGKMIFQLDDTKWSYDLTSQSLPFFRTSLKKSASRKKPM